MYNALTLLDLTDWDRIEYNQLLHVGTCTCGDKMYTKKSFNNIIIKSNKVLFKTMQKRNASLF